MTVSIHPIATRKSHPYNPVDLICWVIEKQGKWTPGDKPGIFHCTIPKEWVKGEILTLIAGVEYESVVSFNSRKGVEEDPRQEVKIKGVAADPVADADVIIYSHELLGKDASSEADFEVIAVRGLTSTPNPRPLNTLLHNVFGMSGGTPVEGSAEEKLEMIRQSFLFWKDKAMII